jgi:hypothetical protein
LTILCQRLARRSHIPTHPYRTLRARRPSERTVDRQDLLTILAGVLAVALLAVAALCAA